MLKKTFTLASAISLTGAVVWMTSTTACGGDEADAAPGNTTSSGSASGDGGSSSGSTSSGGTSGTTSSSGSTTSSSGLIDPKTVPGVDVTFGKCEEFTKCPGSITGSWKVTGGCLADNTFDEFRTFCQGLNEHDIVIKASGTVDATDTVVKQATTVFLSAKLDFPVDCAKVIPGGGGCSSIPSLLTGPFAPPGKKFDHMECTQDGDLCKCGADVKIEETTADDYTKDDTGVLTTKGNRTYEYCPKGGNVTYRETTKDNRTFGMLITIGK